jgi:hypothetical protein
MTDEHRHPRCVSPSSGAPLSIEDALAWERNEHSRTKSILEVVAAERDALEAEVQRLLCWTVGAYVDGEIVDEANLARFESHLLTCEACQYEVKELSTLADRLSGMERTDG